MSVTPNLDLATANQDQVNQRSIAELQLDWQEAVNQQAVPTEPSA